MKPRTPSPNNHAKTRSWIRQALLVLIALILIYFALEFLLRRDAFYNSIASGLYKLGRAEQASSLWEKRLDPDDADPVPEANYGKNAFRQGQYSEADKHISEALRDDPENPVLNYDQGNTQYREEKLDNALESYKKAMLADPTDQDAKSNYELVLNRKGYKKPKPEDHQDEEKEQDKDPVPPSDYENTLDALDQKESNDRQEPGRPQEEPMERWW
ncbi:MAG TPA: hypothetical protein PKI63_02010 [Candidatus Cloacimonadota bacterium]|nr:hypothetical protein [Candidatus Cloacimonadota bacterium]